MEAFPDIYQLPVLPAAESAGGEAGFCRSGNLIDEPCFRAGDPRVNENQGGKIRDVTELGNKVEVYNLIKVNNETLIPCSTRRQVYINSQSLYLKS